VAVNLVPNERSKVRALAGTEPSRGAGGTPTFQLMGDFRISEREPLIEREEYTGTLDPWISPETGPYEVDGTYAELLTFESLAEHLRYGMNGNGAVPVGDANPTPGYTYTYDPCTAVTDIDSMVVEHGPPGLPETAKGVMHRQWTIAADTDDAEGAWKWDSQLFVTENDLKVSSSAGVQIATGGSTTTVIRTAAGYTVDALIGAYLFIRSGAALGDARKIVDNDATTLTVDPAFTAAVGAGDTYEVSGQFTAGIAVPQHEKIKAAGTKVFIDNAGGTLGATQLLDKAISWSVTHALDMTGKRFLEYERGYSPKVGEGWRRVTGQVRIEFDDWYEYEQFTGHTTRLLRFEREGSTIDTAAATKKLARIDVYAAYWNEVARDQDRNANLTRVYQFKGYLDATAGRVARVTVKNRLAALP
jgi:hypothetical protein